MNGDAEQKQMGFCDHLEEFRWVIIKSVVVLAVTSIGAWFVTDLGFELLQRPLENVEEDIQPILTGPLDAFLIKVKLSVLTGVVIGCPIILWIIWSFVAPGLHRQERVLGVCVIVFGTLFFFAGVGFAYAILPISVNFLASFKFPNAENLYDIQKYLSFVFRLLLACGILFEMPVVFTLLTRLGIVSVNTLKRVRPYAFMGMLIISAVLTPPDIFTQLILVGPLIVLYELSILLGAIQEKRAARGPEDDEEDTPPDIPGEAEDKTRPDGGGHAGEIAEPKDGAGPEEQEEEGEEWAGDEESEEDHMFSMVYQSKNSLEEISSPLDENESLFEDDESGSASESESESESEADSTGENRSENSSDGPGAV